MIHISSKDIDSGSSNSGTWNLNSSIQGLYKLKQFHLNSNIQFPWVWTGIHILQVGYDTFGNGNIEDYAIDFNELGTINTIAYETNTSTIASFIADIFGQGYLNGLVEFTCEYLNGYYILTSSETIHLQWNHEDTTCSGIFGKEGADTEIGTTFYLSAKGLTPTPKCIECKITESSSIAKTSRNSKSTLILSTIDGQFLNQNIMFNNNITSLNISFYKEGVSIEPFPNEFDWDLIFKV